MTEQARTADYLSSAAGRHVCSLRWGSVSATLMHHEPEQQHNTALTPCIVWTGRSQWR